ncbi:MAG: hypothetical protein V4673_14385 [Pseudomonadota bacterium]
MTSAQPEQEIDRETVSLLTHDMVLSVDPETVVVRIFSKGVTAAHIGLSPERAMKLGATFMRAALRIKPSLRSETITVIEGEGPK